MYFDTYGPFEVEKTDGEIRGTQTVFWEQVRAGCGKWGYDPMDLERGIGCYALVIRNRVYKPWYVGKTVAQAGFRGEIFQKHKLSIYSEYVSNRRGTPYMFLFPLLTERGGFSDARVSGADVIDWLEKTLIGMAFAKNPLLRNTANTKHLRQVRVAGIIGQREPGRPNSYTVEARSAFLATPRPPRRSASAVADADPDDA